MIYTRAREFTNEKKQGMAVDCSQRSLSSLHGAVDCSQRSLSSLHGAVDRSQRSLSSLHEAIDCSQRSLSSLHGAVDCSQRSLSRLHGAVDRSRRSLSRLHEAVDARRRSLSKNKFNYAITAILVATMCFKIAVLGELAHVALGCSGRETEFRNDIIRSDILFVGHKHKNIDHFL